MNLFGVCAKVVLKKQVKQKRQVRKENARGGSDDCCKEDRLDSESRPAIGSNNSRTDLLGKGASIK